MSKILTFEEWLALDKRVPEREWTVKQYGDYLQGWRNSMPWAWRGMSLAYDGWAEGVWESCPDREKLRVIWATGLKWCADKRMDGDFSKEHSVKGMADVALGIVA